MTLILTCAIGAIVSIALYLTIRQLRQLVAWVMRSEPPRERLGALIVIAALVGAFVGGLAHQPVMAAIECHASGQPVIPCTFFP